MLMDSWIIVSVNNAALNMDVQIISSSPCLQSISEPVILSTEYWHTSSDDGWLLLPLLYLSTLIYRWRYCITVLVGLRSLVITAERVCFWEVLTHCAVLLTLPFERNPPCCELLSHETTWCFEFNIPNMGMSHAHIFSERTTSLCTRGCLLFKGLAYKRLKLISLEW